MTLSLPAVFYLYKNIFMYFYIINILENKIPKMKLIIISSFLQNILLPSLYIF